MLCWFGIWNTEIWGAYVIENLAIKWRSAHFLLCDVELFELNKVETEVFCNQTEIS